MTTCKPAPRETTRPTRSRVEPLPPRPDRRLWETDRDRAFDAGVRWFLAVSRVA